MITEASMLLLESTLASTAAALLVLALRRPLLRRFGARCAYGAWLLLPMALLAVALPAPVAKPAPARSAAADVGAPLRVDTATDAGPVEPRTLLLLLWAGGCVLAAAAAIRRQRRFSRRLGPLRLRADGSFLAARADAGPLVVGLWRPRVVLPADFEQRFDPLEQDLVLRHERVHIARGDLFANLAAAAAACVFWFNPVLRLALGRLRFDQELAADAAVLSQRPEARRPYASAMLKTQGPFHAPPLGCHWQSAHPLKERVAMLKQPMVTPVRLAAGRLLVVALSLSTAFAVWAAQTPQAGADAAVDAAAATQVRLYAGEKLLQSGSFGSDRSGEMRLEKDGVAMTFRFERIEAETVTIATRLERDGIVVAQPRLLARRGSTASFEHEPEAGETVRVEFDLAPPAVATPQVAPAVEASYARLAPPKYPAAALGAKAEGKVMLLVQLDALGMVQSVEVDASSGHAELDAAAAAAAREWKFNPARENGVPVPSRVAVPVQFALKETPAPSAAPAEDGVLDRIDVRER